LLKNAGKKLKPADGKSNGTEKCGGWPNLRQRTNINIIPFPADVLINHQTNTDRPLQISAAQS